MCMKGRLNARLTSEIISTRATEFHNFLNCFSYQGPIEGPEAVIVSSAALFFLEVILTRMGLPLMNRKRRASEYRLLWVGERKQLGIFFGCSFRRFEELDLFVLARNFFCVVPQDVLLYLVLIKGLCPIRHGAHT